MTEDMSEDGFYPKHDFQRPHLSDAPVCWPVLSATERHDAAEDLKDWVRWLVHRYGLDPRTVTPCWTMHGELVEELSALRTAWIACYTWPLDGSALLAWHASFAESRVRLSEWISRNGCRPGEHRG